jgi:hypothetical protein
MAQEPSGVGAFDVPSRIRSSLSRYHWLVAEAPIVNTAYLLRDEYTIAAAAGSLAQYLGFHELGDAFVRSRERDAELVGQSLGRNHREANQ